MKIELIRLKFNDTHSYKYKPFKYCCDEIQNNECIEFTNENLTNLNVDYDEEYGFIPQFCISHTEFITSSEDEWAQTDNYSIKFCPHCGKKIDISVVDEIDISDKYKELSKQRDELWRKCRRTDSKKKEFELREQIGKLDKQINGFYWLDEWKGEY